MRPEQFATGMLAVLAAGLVGAALWVVGGPAQGQLERRDKVRADHLGAIHECLGDMSSTARADIATRPLSNPLPCGRSLTLVDPFSEKPYEFKSLGDDTYQICAVFEQPMERVSMFTGQRIDPTSGCMAFTPNA